LIKNQVNSLDKIKEIELDGYKFNEKRSDQRKFMFIKPYTEQ